MALPSVEYVRRDPGGSVLHQVVRDHFETFRVEAAHVRDGEGLPRFVEEEFQPFLRCGWPAGGFARFRCDGCGVDRLVAFSCKGRGFCPSCGGRRMTERAAHLGAVRREVLFHTPTFGARQADVLKIVISPTTSPTTPLTCLLNVH